MLKWLRLKLLGRSPADDGIAPVLPDLALQRYIQAIDRKGREAFATGVFEINNAPPAKDDDAEYQRVLDAINEEMARLGLDPVMASTPEGVTRHMGGMS